MSDKLTGENKRSVFASSLILLLANLLPLLAVWKMNWSIYDLILLYWVEIILIGLINIPRMILIAPRDSSLSFHLLKIAFVPFFAGHFGFFCVGVGLGLQVIFGKENFEVENQLLSLFVEKGSRIFWPLVISHVFSFFWNYLSQKGYRKTTIMRRMVAPYVRTIPILALVTLGALSCLRFDVPAYSLYALVLGKAIVDLVVHVTLQNRNLTFIHREPVRAPVTPIDSLS